MNDIEIAILILLVEAVTLITMEWRCSSIYNEFKEFATELLKFLDEKFMEIEERRS